MRQVGFILQCQCVCLKLLYEYNDAHLRRNIKYCRDPKNQAQSYKLDNEIYFLVLNFHNNFVFSSYFVVN